MSVLASLDPSTIELQQFVQVSRFLAREAKLLDERRFEEWLDLVAEDIIYEVPLRQAKMKYSEELQGGGYRISEGKDLLRFRVKRSESGYAWSETPPSLTLRVVGSVIVNTTDEPNVVEAESAMLLYRQRGADGPGDMLPLRRQDRIFLGEGGPKLLKRLVLITETVLQTPNLGIFL